MTQKNVEIVLKIGMTEETIDDISPSKPVSGKPLTPSDVRKLNFDDIIAAEKRIRPDVSETPCVKSRLCEYLGMKLYLKEEFCHFTGSFKERGARNALLCLDEATKKKGIITVSAGNFAFAISYHCKNLGIRATVVLPTTTPVQKIECCETLGTCVIIEGKDMGECFEVALKICSEKNLHFIHPFDELSVMAGQGTIGLEILKQVPDVDVVVVPVGGGSLISGSSTAIKKLKPEVIIVAVESDACPAYNAALEKCCPTRVEVKPTIAEGLACPTVGMNTFYNSEKNVYKSVLVSEDEISKAILKFAECEKCTVEGAGAATLAAILTGKLDEFKNKTIVALVTGGNINITTLVNVIQRGMALEERILQFSLCLPDSTCSVRDLCSTLAENNVKIRSVKHDRTCVNTHVHNVIISAECETHDMDHSNKLKSILQEKFGTLHLGNIPKIT